MVRPSVIAHRAGVTPQAVGQWVRQGLIPSSAVLRIGSAIRIDRDIFEILLKTGQLYRPKGQAARGCDCSPCHVNAGLLALVAYSAMHGMVVEA